MAKPHMSESLKAELRAYWASIEDELDEMRELGIVYICRSSTGSRLHVSAPARNDKFIDGARGLDGRWRKRTKRWSFPLSNYTKVVNLCISVWGNDKVKIG